MSSITKNSVRIALYLRLLIKWKLLYIKCKLLFFIIFLKGIKFALFASFIATAIIPTIYSTPIKWKAIQWLQLFFILYRGSIQHRRSLDRTEDLQSLHEAKITDFKYLVFCDEDVGRLQISVYDVVRMNALEAFDDLFSEFYSFLQKIWWLS